MRVRYAIDAYCPWCYGFGAALEAFAAANAECIDLRVLPAGLFSGARAGPVAAYPQPAAAEARIGALTRCCCTP
ncbi:hypothetical protein ABZ297_11420 [Nonomuraea sp. NPDC005983]|uniref:hypothetical protein n=1 Tax=Nonomuraea sp. NPDC005983 TaxID=3155595 RepID=UPI0033B99B88